MRYAYTKVLLLLLFSLITSAHAQQFKWVRGGGSTYNFSASIDWEQVRYMCTDPNGNIYVISNVGPTSISADTFHASVGNSNTLVTSYTCNGQMRWAKLIYATSQDTYPAGIVADSLGNIYVAGEMAPSNASLHIGYDTVISGTAYEYEATSVLQFDTSGRFHWIRFVGQNTIATLYGTQYYYSGEVLKTDALNNVHYLAYMSSGVPITSSITSTAGTYDLVYSSAGTLISEKRLDMDSIWFLNDAVIDPISNKLYVTGELSGSFLASHTDTSFAAAFDANRNRVWQYFAGHGDDDGLSGIVMDGKRNLLFSGAAQGSPISGGPIRFIFNGDSTIAGATGDLGIIMKTDTNGTVKWIKRFDSYISVNGLGGITLLSNDKVAAAGTYAGTVKCGLDSLVTPAGDGYDPYIAIVDSAGDLQVLAQAYGDGFYNSGNVITSDQKENIYMGGYTSDSVWAGIPPVPAYHTVGGNSDFFIAKYGVDCNCTYIPIASYTDTGHHTVGVTYTGTPTGIDSVVWNFGDTTALVTGTTATHTYTYYGTYRVCATVYTTCGNDIYCTDVHYQSTTGMPALSQNEIQVFPNPSNELLNITGFRQIANYRLLSVTGTCVSQGILRQQPNVISMRNFASGIYILEMTGEDGQRDIVRVVKE